MSNAKNRENNTLQTAATAALAATSKTPFRTAFKITMGIAAAQLLIGVTVLIGLFCIFVLIGYLVK